MSTALCIHEYVSNRRQHGSQSGVINKLNVNTVKIKKKGNMGANTFIWNPRFSSSMEGYDTRDVGSLSLACTTDPGNLTISIFYFFNSGKVKVSGKTIDPEVAEAFGHDPTLSNTQATDEGLKKYFNSLMEETARLFGITPKTENFPLCFLNGGFKIKEIPSSQVQEMAIKSREFPQWFLYATGQEPEINGRMFGISLYLSEKLKVTFDHKGKVQVFSAKSYSDIIKCRDVLLKYIEECERIGIIDS